MSVRYDLELRAIASAALGARARALDGRPDDGANSDEAGESEGIPVTGAKEGHGGWSAAFVDIYGDVGGGESGSVSVSGARGGAHVAGGGSTK